MGIVRPDDEFRHPFGSEPLWNESWYMDWFQADGSVGGYIRIGFVPQLNAVWYWACLVGEGRELVWLVDHDVAIPDAADSLEIRHDGLWADHVIAEPLERLECSLEAFALRLSDPGEAVAVEPRGERVPFGFELDFDTDRGAYMWPPITPRYEIPCRVTGRVLVGDEEIVVDGWGQRDHSWGATRDWWANTWCWTAGRLDDGTRVDSTGALFEGSDFGVAYSLAPGLTDFAEFDEVRHRFDGDLRWPSRVEVGFGDVTSTWTPRQWAPVGLHDGAGRRSHFARALCSIDTGPAAGGSGDRRGFGWLERNLLES